MMHLNLGGGGRLHFRRNIGPSNPDVPEPENCPGQWYLPPRDIIITIIVFLFCYHLVRNISFHLLIFLSPGMQ